MKKKATKRHSRKKPALRPCARVLAMLRERIAAADRADQSGASLGSEVEIARVCRVSRMTVRKAVDILVGEGLVERRAGVGLFARVEGSCTRTIRFVVCNLLWDSSLQIVLALRGECRPIGIDVQIRDGGGDTATFLREIRDLPNSGCDGAVVLALHLPEFEQAVREVVATGFKLAVIDEKIEGIPCVVSDNVRGGALAAHTLQKAGHTRVAFLGDLVSDTVEARRRGFCEYPGWAKGQKPEVFDIKDSQQNESWEAPVAKILDAVFARPAEKRPTALFCSCDAAARFVYRNLEARGVKIPAQMSVIGFDDDPISEWVRPALTTVRQDFSAIGAAALRALHTGAGTIVPVSLVSRNSVADEAK